MYMYNTYIYPYNSLQTFLLFVVARRRHGGSEGLAFTPRVYVYTYVSTRITHFKLSFCVPPVTWRRHGRAEGLTYKYTHTYIHTHIHTYIHTYSPGLTCTAPMFLQLPGVDMVVQKGSLSLVEFGNELLAALAAKQPYILPGFTV